MESAVLRWFQQVADGATVTEVSELGQVTQSGVSRALARLEAEVGTPLLRRSGRTLRMTRAGAAFKRHVDGLLHELDDGLAAVNQLIEPETGTVTLAFQLSFGSWLIPDLVATFRARHPEVRFAFRHVQDPVGPDVQLETADLVLTTIQRGDPDLEWRWLLSEPLHLVVPAGHRLAGRVDPQLAEAAEESFVMLSHPWSLRHVADSLCAQAGFQPMVAFEADELSTIRGLVAAGLGVAILPALRDRESGDAAGLWSAPISDPGAHLQVSLVWSKRQPLLPSAALFRDHVPAWAASEKLTAGRRVARGGAAESA
jgi:LysR family transcriptional activator of glutamate synthase operon